MQLAVHVVHIRQAGEQGAHWDNTNNVVTHTHTHTHTKTSLRKFGNLSIREKLGYDVSVRPKADRTDLDSGEEKRSQESARRWDEYVIA